MIIIALVNPKVGVNSEKIKGTGVEIVLAIDVSKSMLCADVQPTRMEKAKQIATQIVNNMQTDRVGIVAYAATANTTVPMTTDYAMAKMQISSLDTNMISSQGTGIKNAIEAAVSYFDNPKTSKVIVLITDGEDHESDANDISGFAADKNTKMITIGVGTTSGGNISYLDEMGNAQLKEDNQGNVVITKLNENILKEIAAKTSGNYIENKVTSSVLNDVKNALSKIEKSEFKTQQLNEKQSQFQWFLGIAILLCCLHFINENIKNKL